MNIFIPILLFISFFSAGQDLNIKNYSAVPYESKKNICKTDLGFYKEWKIYEKGKESSAIYSLANNVYEALFENKIIEDPYSANNEQDLQWVSERDWVFENSFYTSNYLHRNKKSSYFIKFSRLDSYATVYLNDVLILTANNAFVTYEVEVSNLLKEENILKIIFESAKNKTKEISDKYPVKLPGGNRVFVRKPQYQFGWDWGPTLINCGYGKIELIEMSKKALKIDPIKITTIKIENENAWLKVSTIIFCTKPQTIYLKCLINDCINTENKKDTTYIQYQGKKLKKGENILFFEVLLKKAKLWYPRFYGEPNTYTINFSIRETAPGQKQTEYLYLESVQYGICKSELVREKDDVGETFYFRINGKRIYARGFNYIPNDFLNPQSRTTKNNSVETTNKNNLAAAYKMNCNMLRVWGGGIYQDAYFYEFCLMNGILVWQDFMFACAMYPYDIKYLESLKIETEQQTKRLQNYSNIVLWCGNNENEEGWYNWGWQKEFSYSKNDSSEIYNGNKNIFEKLIPNTLKNIISKANYISSSPQFGWGREKSMQTGDSHYWGVWWGLEPIENFNKKIPRFMSEFGMQALPDANCFKNFVPDSLLNFTSKEFLNHQKHPSGFKNLNHYLKEYFYETENLIDYAYLTQCMQSLTLSTAIEAQRRSFPYCNGTLIWQLNDCWPAVSWSVIDYLGSKKIATHQIEKDFDTLLLSMKEEQGRYDYYLINDSDFSLNDSLEFYISDFKGNHLYNKQILINCPPRSSSIVFQLKETEISAINKNKIFALASFKKTIYRKNFHFVKPNQLLLEQANINVSGLENKPNGIDRIGAVLKSTTYCPYVKISSQKSSYSFYQYLPFILPNEKIILPNSLFNDVKLAEDVKLVVGKDIRCLNEFSYKTKYLNAK